MTNTPSPQPSEAPQAFTRRDAARRAATEILLGVNDVPRRSVLPSFGEAERGADTRAGEGERQRESPPASGARAAPAAGRGRQDDRAQRLEALRLEHDAGCPHCTAATAHTRTVFGEGNAAAALMFVGEAPGETEDRLGRPFVGRAGEKLDEIISAMSLRREDVYIANVLKSRPPGNRTPLQHEVDACGPYLRRQIAIIAPRVIVTLGGPATKLLLGVEQGITRLRGIWSAYRDPESGLETPVMPTFHPAYLLRNYTAQTRRQVWDDMKQVLARLGADAP